jgi:hypothetical protein
LDEALQGRTIAVMFRHTNGGSRHRFVTDHCVTDRAGRQA